MSDESVVEVDGQQYSLADIAGVDMSQVNEVRGFKFPKGLFKWRVLSSELKKIKDGAGIANELECLEVVNCNDPEAGDHAKIPGKKFTHTQFLNNEGLGRQKAFMGDTGFQGQGTLLEVLNQFTGYEFYGKVIHRPNQNDKDNPFVNLDLSSIKPVSEMPNAMPAGSQPASGGLMPSAG